MRLLMGMYTINLSPNLEVIYNGEPRALTASIETLADVQPMVYYYTDETYKNGETTLPPVNVGKDYVKAVLLDLVDSMGSSTSNTVPLKSGSLTHTFSNVAFGEVTVTVTYIPEINENGNTYNDPYYNGMVASSETFEVVKDYIPVQDIEFIAPQLQCYVQFDGTQYQNLTNMQLPVIITPNNASNQGITQLCV